jgi:hypothetical protein
VNSVLTSTQTNWTAMQSATHPTEEALTSLTIERAVFAYYFYWGM